MFNNLALASSFSYFAPPWPPLPPPYELLSPDNLPSPPKAKDESGAAKISSVATRITFLLITASTFLPFGKRNELVLFLILDHYILSKDSIIICYGHKTSPPFAEWQNSMDKEFFII
jgi:hypothetical protein